MIQELESQKQLVFGMHPSGPMPMSPQYGHGHGHGHDHGHGHGHGMMQQHQSGFMTSHMQGGGGYGSAGMHQMQPQHHQMGHYQYHNPSGPNMSSTNMNSSYYSNGGMHGAPNMSRIEYDSFQKAQSHGQMHLESKYHQEQSSFGNNGGGMSFMPSGGYGGRRAQWVTKAL